MKFPAFFYQLRSQRPQDIPHCTTTDKFLVFIASSVGNLVESLQSQSIKNGKFPYELTGRALNIHNSANKMSTWSTFHSRSIDSCLFSWYEPMCDLVKLEVTASRKGSLFLYNLFTHQVQLKFKLVIRTIVH